MCKLILYEFKKMYYRHTTWVILLMCISIALLAFIFQLSNYPWIPEKNNMEPASESSLIWSNPLTFMVLAVITPLSASMIHADTYHNEYSNKLVSVIISKRNRFCYYISKATVVIIASFIVSILPFLINQLLCQISFPSQTLRIFGDGIYENNYQYLLSRIKYKYLYFNHPIAYNYLHVLLVGMYGVVMGMLSFSISLFYNKKKVIVILSSTMLMFGLLLIASAFGLYSMVFQDYLVAKPTIKNVNVNILYVFLIFSMLMSFLSILYKIYIKKDVLWFWKIIYFA